jgi:hypothetical protein
MNNVWADTFNLIWTIHNAYMYGNSEICILEICTIFMLSVKKFSKKKHVKRCSAPLLIIREMQIKITMRIQ